MSFTGTGLRFKAPKVDSCHTCDLLKAKIEVNRSNNTNEIIQLEDSLKEHHLLADLSYKSKQTDKDLARQDSSVKTYMLYLQQCLPTPLLKTSIAFYKRQLWTFNLTIHDGATGIPFCYWSYWKPVWHEATAKRGGNEIASCLFKHLKSIQNDGAIKHIIFYSDSCPGQNRNSYISTMFMTFLYTMNNQVKTIDHKYLIPGHTHMECDVDHSVIERKKKKTQTKIHHPRDWYNFIRSVGVKKKFSVIEMEKEDFIDFSGLLKKKFLWRSRCENAETFIWKNVKWLRYEKENFGRILYKTSLDQSEPFKILNISKRGISAIVTSDLEIIKEEIKICSKKKKDLLEILPLIDPGFHLFYKNLPTEQMAADFHPNITESIEKAWKIKNYDVFIYLIICF